ncbi:hypothetical protein G7092_05685 [Mucilaginibacter sp. HC2]|uniref:hypothetical protein n=1 Tax=Mucilaginibacter inviolabilis TaxID=2714892 RepID=UPI00140AD785|nr:hypothetical protein [Mucilaginibacter inviolabilis]NHA03272.1 hypothetical protein [Mucilaginibacter inviolabilis]
MTRTKLTIVLFGSIISSCATRILYDHLRKNKDLESGAMATIDGPRTPDHIKLNAELKNAPFAERSITRALFAYDTSDHKTLMHIRFDRQTVDTLNKFKLATGVDMSKFVAFAVRVLLNTNPEFKSIINKYLQRTQL